MALHSVTSFFDAYPWEGSPRNWLRSRERQTRRGGLAIPDDRTTGFHPRELPYQWAMNRVRCAEAQLFMSMADLQVLTVACT